MKLSMKRTIKAICLTLSAFFALAEVLFLFVLLVAELNPNGYMTLGVLFILCAAAAWILGEIGTNIFNS